MKEKYFTVADSISRWKIDTPFENWLGHKADNSNIWKRLYVLYYRIFDGKYYKKGLELAKKEVERQKRNASLPEWGGYLYVDMIYSQHRFGATFEDYFIYNFYNLNAFGRSKFNTLKLQYGYCQLVNAEHIRELFEDKGACYEKFREFYRRDLCVVKQESDMDGFRNFVRRHPSFIYKPINGHSGTGIKIYKDVSEDKETLLGIMHAGDGQFVAEELIEQAEGMKVLHAESINTIRILTFTVNGDVNVMGAAIRMGVGKANVDNAGAGGIYAGVDAGEGIVNSLARNNEGDRYLRHPDTSVVIPGFVVPQWKEALELVCRMALTEKGATAIAWDLAYSTKGWLMVEGNDVGDPYLLQAPLQKGIKQEIINNIDNYLKK